MPYADLWHQLTQNTVGCLHRKGVLCVCVCGGVLYVACVKVYVVWRVCGGVCCVACVEGVCVCQVRSNWHVYVSE